MENINSKFLNKVKERYLPLPKSVVEEYEHEPNISDFETVKQLGFGSFGKIYLVIHKKTRAKYALKIINKSDEITDEQKKYYKREVEILYKCSHPNIVKLYGHFEDNNYCYYVMEYFPNGSAYDLIPKEGKRQEKVELIASVMKDLISAIYYLHNMNPKVIHRDIKPENILLDENNKAHLIDFGWSNYLINNRKRNTICGTPLYSPPEMILDTGHDEKVDIWCIGVLLFELLTGDVPFDGNDAETVKNNITELNITWPTYVIPEAKDLIIKILKINPSERPSIEAIITHNFFKKFFPNAINELIKPDKIKTKIFIISTDNPKTWSQFKGIQNSYNKKPYTEKKIFQKMQKNNDKDNKDNIEKKMTKETKTKNISYTDNKYLYNKKTQPKIKKNYVLSPLQDEGSPSTVKRNINFYDNSLYNDDYKTNTVNVNKSYYNKNNNLNDTYNSFESKTIYNNKTLIISNNNSKEKNIKRVKTVNDQYFHFLSEYKANTNNKKYNKYNNITEYLSRTNFKNKYNSNLKGYIKSNTANNSIIFSNKTSDYKKYNTINNSKNKINNKYNINSNNTSIQNNNKFSSLSKKYEELKKEYDTLKKNKLDKLKNELKDIEIKLTAEYLKHNKLFVFDKISNINNSGQYKLFYEKLKKENNELKEKIKKYSNYLGRKNNNTDNDKKLIGIIKEKESKINRYKKEIKYRRIKERGRFYMLINKYDKTLILQEKENKTLKRRLKELEKLIL